MKNKKWKYHLTHSFKDKEKEHYGVTQLYQIGVYMIVNNNPQLKFNMKPNQMVIMERKLRKSFEKGEISDLKFGKEITVIENENGFYEEILE